MSIGAAALSVAVAGVVVMPQLVSADEGDTNTNGSNSAPRQAGGDNADVDLRTGAVFVMSNNEDANEVVAFARAEDGTLTEVGRFPTGGKGSGSFEDSANALVLGSAAGEASPNQLTDKARLLFVPNAGSSTISVFTVNADGIELVEETPSGGQKPVSLTVNDGLLYVLNSGETDNRLFTEGTNTLENCTTGSRPEITGFNVSTDGRLTPVENSTRTLSGRAKSGCAQVSFSADGTTLMVTERLAELPAHERSEVEDDEGAIVMFQVLQDGTTGRKQVVDSTGRGPFGFNVAKSGNVLVTEQFGGFFNEGASALSAYKGDGEGGFESISDAVFNKQTDTCWVVVNDQETVAWASSPFGNGTISSFSLEDGVPELIHESASAKDGKDSENDNVAVGATDLALSGDSQYLYQLNSFEGALNVFRTSSDGSLEFVEDHQIFELETFGEGGEGDPMGLAAI
jgi:6-phosphogluconolactonase (cycloisomerase 2 family)